MLSECIKRREREIKGMKKGCRVGKKLVGGGSSFESMGLWWLKIKKCQEKGGEKRDLANEATKINSGNRRNTPKRKESKAWKLTKDA